MGERAQLNRVARAAARAKEAAQVRDDAIREAHAQGVTMRSIAEAAKLSPGRVHQLIHKKPPQRANVRGRGNGKDTSDASKT